MTESRHRGGGRSVLYCSTDVLVLLLTAVVERERDVDRGRSVTSTVRDGAESGAVLTEDGKKRRRGQLGNGAEGAVTARSEEVARQALAWYAPQEDRPASAL